jgi:hypothetical protein
MDQAFAQGGPSPGSEGFVKPAIPIEALSAENPHHQRGGNRRGVRIVHVELANPSEPSAEEQEEFFAQTKDGGPGVDADQPQPSLWPQWARHALNDHGEGNVVMQASQEIVEMIEMFR